MGRARAGEDGEKLGHDGDAFILAADALERPGSSLGIDNRAR